MSNIRRFILRGIKHFKLTNKQLNEFYRNLSPPFHHTMPNDNSSVDIFFFLAHKKKQKKNWSAPKVSEKSSTLFLAYIINQGNTSRCLPAYKDNEKGGLLGGDDNSVGMVDVLLRCLRGAVGVCDKCMMLQVQVSTLRV